MQSAQAGTRWLRLAGLRWRCVAKPDFPCAHFWACAGPGAGQRSTEFSTSTTLPRRFLTCYLTPCMSKVDCACTPIHIHLFMGFLCNLLQTEHWGDKKTISNSSLQNAVWLDAGSLELALLSFFFIIIMNINVIMNSSCMAWGKVGGVYKQIVCKCLYVNMTGRGRIRMRWRLCHSSEVILLSRIQLVQCNKRPPTWKEGNLQSVYTSHE